jgi:ribonucleotide reductase alpha subunit
VKNGHTRDLLFEANGTLAEVEEEVALDTLPAAVKTALAAHGTLVKVESVTKGTTVVYEGVVEKTGKRSEVKVTPEGLAVAR